MKPLYWIAAGGAALAVTLIARAVGKPSMPTCSDRYKALHFGGTRDTSKLRLIVLHSTEGATADGAAQWFANPESQGSAHVVVGEDGCFRTLPDNVVPYGSRGGRSNEDGLHVEMAGFARWTRDQWLQHRDTLQKSAAVVSSWASMYGIPLVFLNASDLRRMGNTARGVTTHAAITQAFNSDDHTDPGVQFPLDVLMQQAGGTAPRVA